METVLAGASAFSLHMGHFLTWARRTPHPRPYLGSLIQSNERQRPGWHRAAGLWPREGSNYPANRHVFAAEVCTGVCTGSHESRGLHAYASATKRAWSTWVKCEAAAATESCAV